MDPNPAQSGDVPILQQAKQAQPAQPGQQPVVAQSSIKVKPKVIIIIVSAVVAVAAALLVLFLVVLPAFSVSEKDYEDAYDLAATVSSDCSKVGSSLYISSITTANQLTSKVDSLKESLKECDDAIKELSEAKAITRDSEAKELYTAFNDKYTKYKEAEDVAIEALEKIFAPIIDYTKTSSSYSSDDALKAISSLKTALDKVGDLKYDQNKKFLKNLQTAATKLEKAVKEYQTAYQAYKDDWRNNSYPSSTPVYDASSDLTDTMSDWKDEVEKLTEGNDPSSKLSKLRNYLSDKQYGE